VQQIVGISFTKTFGINTRENFLEASHISGDSPYEARSTTAKWVVSAVLGVHAKLSQPLRSHVMESRWGRVDFSQTIFPWADYKVSRVLPVKSRGAPDSNLEPREDLDSGTLLSSAIWEGGRPHF